MYRNVCFAVVTRVVHKTSNDWWSGTDADVSVEGVTNAGEKCDFGLLDRKDRDDRQRGKLVFSVREASVGDIFRINL